MEDKTPYLITKMHREAWLWYKMEHWHYSSVKIPGISTPQSFDRFLLLLKHLNSVQYAPTLKHRTIVDNCISGATNYLGIKFSFK